MDAQLTEPSETAADSAPAAESLTASDRCDSCGSQAFVRAVMPHGELLFCSHHGRKFHDQLAPLVTKWVDESHRLEVVR